ncbi:MAG TPA: phosphoribosylglycinamide formyltransferase [Longimicrobiaceae bacterium]|nr:phosphoribosylglycinamide formyltransferase [Longimicrobiaceae bacterium]
MPAPARVAVFASGGGTNLQALIDHFNPAPHPAARVELVVASRAGTGAEERAARAGVAALVLDGRELGADAVAARMLEALERHRIDLVVLAGYLVLVPAPVVARYHGRMLNIHPALLPGFGGQGMYGLRVHRAVLEAGVRVTGATVHLVGDRYDEGAIVAQWPVPVLPGDTPEALAARGLAVEPRSLPLAVEALARGASAAADAAGPLAFDLAALPAPPEESVRVTLAVPPRAEA